jgi:hypothetical protein
VQVTSFEDNPFTMGSHVELIPREYFFLDDHGHPMGLEGPNVQIVEPELITSMDGTHWRDAITVQSHRRMGGAGTSRGPDDGIRRGEYGQLLDAQRVRLTESDRSLIDRWLPVA